MFSKRGGLAEEVLIKGENLMSQTCIKKDKIFNLLFIQILLKNT